MNDIKEILESSIKIWNKLDIEEQDYLVNNAKAISYHKGDTIHKGNLTCLGLIIIKKGLVRAYISSENGKQITIYRLLENDICLFSASCIMQNINFEIFLECEEDTKILLVPTEKFKYILDKSPIMSSYINEILSSRFSDAMWVLEQFVFHSLDERLANYLLEHNYNGGEIITTHEKIANDLGSAREVISRMLKCFEDDKIIKLDRNKITILNENKLEKIVEK